MTKIETITERRSTRAKHWTDEVAKQDRLDTRAFAEQYRLRVKYDERTEKQDLHIPGARGQLYLDGGQLCRMVLDGKPAIRSNGQWSRSGRPPWKEPSLDFLPELL